MFEFWEETLLEKKGNNGERSLAVIHGSTPVLLLQNPYVVAFQLHAYFNYKGRTKLDIKDNKLYSL